MPSAEITVTLTSSKTVTLTWTAMTGATSYNVYRGGASEGPFAKINAALHPKPTFTDAGVAGGKTYFYVTTAVNQKGHESKFSNPVRVTIPNS